MEEVTEEEQTTLNWDGSHLGFVTDEAFRLICKTRIEYVEFDTSHLFSSSSFSPSSFDCSKTSKTTRRIYCMRKRIKNKFPAIVDEFKELFALKKLGTHTVNKGSTIYLLIKCVVPLNNETLEPNVELEKFLSEIDTKRVSRSFKYEVRKIFLFRMIMGFNTILNRDVILKYEDDKFIPIDFSNSLGQLEKRALAFPQTIAKQWFANISVEEALNEMLYELKYDLPLGSSQKDIVLYLRTKMEKIINRIDKELIWTSVFFVERLLKLLKNIK